MESFDVAIVFTSRITSREQPASQMTKSLTHGRLVKSSGSLYLTFNDTIDEAGNADYTIKVNGNEALIRRKGALPMRQPLMLGETLSGTYDAPFGSMETEATAIKIEAFWDQARQVGKARLVYDLSLQGQYVGQCRHDYRYKVKK